MSPEHNWYNWDSGAFDHRSLETQGNKKELSKPRRQSAPSPPHSRRFPVCSSLREREVIFKITNLIVDPALQITRTSEVARSPGNKGHKDDTPQYRQL